MRAVEEQLARVSEHWPGAIFHQDADFSLQEVNARLEQLSGLAASAGPCSAHQFWELVHEADVEELQRQCQQAGRSAGGVTTTYRIRHAVSGRVSHVREHRLARLSESGQVTGYDVLWVDVTSQTLAEKRLKVAARKAAFSAATMGLAHDFNNQMTGVLALSDLVLAQLPSEDPKRGSLEMLKRTASQAAHLLKRMVNLHRGKPGVRQYVDLNQTVADLGELVGKVLPKRIQVQAELAPEPMPVYLDVVEFGQVVLSLALNAAEVMPSGGTLLLRVRAHTSAPHLKHYRGKLPRLPCGCFSVQDHGRGIAAPHLPSVFEPFFTTKPPTQGAGLGVYQARQFAEAHGGAVSVESAEGAGTTFSLWLPEADFTEAEASAVESAHGPARLLVVGRPGAATVDLVQRLRRQGLGVVVTHVPERAAELLADEADRLQGVFIVAEPEDARLLGLVGALQEQKLTSRVVLGVPGGKVAEVDRSILEQAQLVLGSLEEEHAVVQKLKSLFGVPGMH